jgi:hypothetical protein
MAGEQVAEFLRPELAAPVTVDHHTGCGTISLTV